MQALGLREDDGWKVVEFVRDTRFGSELVLRPIHTWLQTPRDLECVVWVRDEDGNVQSTCDPGGADAENAITPAAARPEPRVKST